MATEKYRDHQYSTTSFAFVIYLAGRGYEPLRAELLRDGSAKVAYIFSPAARDEIATFHERKEHLNQMSIAARTGRRA